MKEEENIDSDAKINELTAFFDGLDNVVLDLSNQLQTIKRKLKVQALANCEEAEQDKQ